jgi:hypothetical protein
VDVVRGTKVSSSSRGVGGTGIGAETVPGVAWNGNVVSSNVTCHEVRKRFMARS